MAIQIHTDRDGDSLIGQYTEAVDEQTGMVVRRIRYFDVFGEYRTPFSGAHLDISTTETFGVPDEGDKTSKYVKCITIQSVRMAELPTREQCKKWGVPTNQVEQATALAVAAIELYAGNLVYSGPVKNIVSVASDVRR